MFSLPTFLSFPWSLPSLSSISLPANIQRRFLSYVLKRSLGRFVRAGGLDVERIQAQIGQGRVEIEELEVNAEEINCLIPESLPLQVTSGSLSKINARIPFPNLWSAPLSLSLDTLTLDLILLSSPSKGKAPSSPRSAFPDSPSLDLASSVTTAADDFLHEELDAYEEAELDRSIRQSLVLNQEDPFLHVELPGAFPTGLGDDSSPLPPNVESTTVLAGLVERVLARLEFKVKNVKIRLHHTDAKHGGVFELRVAEITYADESLSATAEDRQKTVRAIKVSGMSVYMLPHRSKPNPSPPRLFNTTSRSSSTSSTSSSTSSENGNADMMMSQAVADLRQSMATSVASGASVYQSAYSYGLEENMATEEPETDSNTSRSNHRSRSRSFTPTGREEEAPSAIQILSLGTEDVVLRMTTIRPAVNDSPASPDSLAERAGAAPKTTPGVDIDFSIGIVTLLLIPSRMAAILSAVKHATQAPPDASAPAQSSPPAQSLSQIDARFRIKAVHITLIYDLSANDHAPFTSVLPQFWNRPLSTDLPVGHLKFRFDTLQALYSTKRHSSKAEAHPMLSSASARRPSASRSGTTTPAILLSLADASIFEYLASAPPEVEDQPPGGIFPVLIFDPNLPRQYDHGINASASSRTVVSAPAPIFPEFDVVDWRNAGLQRRGPQGEKVWRIRQKGKGVLKSSSTTTDNEGPVLTLRKDLAGDAAVVLDTQPIHLFLDLSLLERLLPMLHHISPAMRAYSETKPPTPAPSVRPSNTKSRFESYVLDDLDAQASVPENQTSSQAATLRCPMLRLSIRCPAPINRRGTWGDGAHLRSGIVTLDLHGLKSTVARSEPVVTRNRSQKRTADDKPNTTVEWKSMLLFFCRAPEKKSSAFLVIGPLAPEPGDSDPIVLLPTVDIASSLSPSTSVKTSLVSCRIPSVQAKIIQTTIVGLQFFADDLTHWLDGAFGDGSRPKPRDELKMIGSRFFGSKASSSASSSMFDDDEDEKSAINIRVLVTETEVVLHVPRDATSDRILAVRASDVEGQFESNVSERQETVLTLSVMDADFSDLSETSKLRKIVARTTPLTLTAHNHPILQLRLSSVSNSDIGAKETDVKATVSSFTFFVLEDITWVTDLARFAKTPEGVFEDVVPSEVTRIEIQVYDGSVHLAAPNTKGALVAVITDLIVKIAIGSEDEEREITLALGAGNVLVIDDMQSAAAIDGRHSTLVESWRGAGYAQIVEITALEAQFVRDLLDPQDVQLDILSGNTKIALCADSLSTLGPLIGDLAKLMPAKKSSAKDIRSPTTLEQSINVFSSIDEDAFNRVPDMISGADLIEDDLPTNLDYLDHATRHSETPSMDRLTGETLRTWQSASGDEEWSGEVGGETIKILHPDSFEMDENYWDSMTPVTNEARDGTKVGNIRVRIHDSAVTVLLHDGYDWQRTRKVIEDEIKSVRKKLERIRQLLASGQTAQETTALDNTRSVLFNSVYIGLDQSQDNLDSAALLAAIDEELEDLGGPDSSSVSSWQTDFPPGHPQYAAQLHRSSGKKTRLKGKRLTRSKKPQIEFGLSGVKLDLDVFEPDHSTASKIEVSVKSMEILDHIKTSTWKKFLSEMKADSRGNVRETDADMVRVQLVAVRPSLPSLEEENRLRMKLLPLRLHVDQDALDFLKRFFGFSPPDPVVDRAEKPSSEPFFQHVEIFPIEMKLDYKPKRVDFAALREGKTMELMNFFHFDGAEMTLRHVTMSGVSGMTRLSTMLQDIWTPDVKANQLADVISGVSPIRSMVNVGSGVADLILLPIEQYRKDGRVSRGVQRGANSFVKSTALEMMKLGARLATGTQVVLEKAEGVLGGRIDKEVVGEVPWTSAGSTETEGGEASSEDEAELVSRYANQPTGAREGVQAAYKSLSKNVNAAAQTILAVPMEVYERSGDDGPLKAVVRAVPIAVLKPMIGASEAVSKTLLGMRNSLDPQGRAEQSDKYK